MWRTFPPQKSENVRRHPRNSIENAILWYSDQTWKCDPIQRHIPISLYKEVTSRSSVYGNDFGVLEVLCEDGECYISWHVFVTQLCNKPFRFSRIPLILLIVSCYIPGLIHPADVFRQVTFTKVNQNLTEQSPPLAPTVPPREQNGSTSGW